MGGGGFLVPRLEDQSGELARLIQSSRAKATRRAYRADLEHASEWCAAHGIEAPLDVEQALRYLAALARAGYAWATITRRAIALGCWHEAAGHPNPCSGATYRAAMAGLARAVGTAPTQRKLPIWLSELLAAVRSTPSQRDRALLLVGWAAALRRSEIASLEWRDLDFSDPRGVLITIRRSKADQTAEGAQVPIPYGRDPGACPVKELRAHLGEPSEPRFPLDTRPVFGVSPKTVNRIVKRAVARIGLDPDLYGAHSLRSGLASSAARAGASDRTIMGTTRHRRASSLEAYVRRGTIWELDAASTAGL